MNTAIEERIRSRAYELWESEGRPHGREIDHWLQAVQELAAEKERSTVGVATAPARKPRSVSATAAKPTTAAKTAKTTTARSRTTKLS
jgi:hypothetical protein